MKRLTGKARVAAREYNSWRAMKKRCYYKKHHNFPAYGGRGIIVCDRWKDSFDTFYEDLGSRPVGKTLDRIDPDGNYEPGNVRWATDDEQRQNKRKKVA